MQQSKKDIELGRFTSLVLRHKPETIGIELDKNGWANVNELLKGMNCHGCKINKEDLERIVKENNKKRYIFNEDKTKIRANQGHSLNVDVELKEAIPPTILYHGTSEASAESIRSEGIDQRDRQFVHLSADMATAVKVGSRHGKPFVFKIDAQKMHEEGYVFYLSENNVWLSKKIPAKYLLK